jgi:hypothetical protein
MVAGVVGNHTYESLILFGGYIEQMKGAHVPLNDLWIFDHHHFSWTKHNTSGIAPPPRFFHTACILQGASGYLMAVFGGASYHRAMLNDTWVLNLTTLEWNQLAFPNHTIPDSRSGHTMMASASGDGLLIGGCLGAHLNPYPFCDYLGNKSNIIWHLQSM